MATLNSQGKRPSPDDEGSDMSDISEGNSFNGRERRTIKRQRTSSSQSEVEDQPAQFVPGLWSIVASVKNLFGLGSSETDPTPGPALETLDRFSPDLPPLPAFHPDGRMLQGPTMPAIEATKHRMNRAFEAQNGETDAEIQNQEHSVIDLTGVSDGSPSPDKFKSGGSLSYNAKFSQLKVRPPTPPRPSSKKNFAPSGLRVHHAFDNGLRHSVGHRARPRYTAKMIRTTVKTSTRT
ncbi:hypothetical protein HD553DRAFT_195915 [Filobasidium floriforme]|uniref:uncharacterized protein n=1 Tax=Filobasidium floriforme TaxID=5210 RepID=UPI001E8E8FDA|nr:uncharacterized protein HD553DRAFT_195915 [Filobasidium floriforme]KAH8087367.1 hypothetical protein HD553DRAFT_195915 [Filobasidium floriforme]